MTFIVAIDGPAAAGKGTISKAVAAEFGLAHLDTGLLYRAVGFKVMSGADPIAAANALNPLDLEHDDLRTANVAQFASQVAVIPEVRSALVNFQRSFATQASGAVLDGRDIGTVICPDADIKLFVTASPEVRANRRFQELSAKGAKTTYEKVLNEVVERDMRDSTRSDAPMRAAVEAIVIDTSELTIESAIQTACDLIRSKQSA